jgi:tetratricopeptide (TPR) repeat protein
MASTRRGSSHQTRAATAALIALCAACPLLLGGVPHWVIWAALPLALAALWLGSSGGRSLRFPVLSWVPLAGAAFSLGQLIPMPSGLLDLFSLEAAGLRDFTVVPLGLSSWRPISIDPPATWEAVAKQLLVAVTIAASAQVIFDSRTARTRLVAVLAFFGAALVLSAAVHELLGLETLFGFHAFQFAKPRLMTPFGNSNHLAGFLILSGTIALAKAIDEARHFDRIRWLLAFTLTAGGVLLSLSRAGILCFFGAQILLLALVAISRRGENDTNAISTETLKWSAVGVVIVSAGAGLLWFERLVDRFMDSASMKEKIALWPQSLETAGLFSRAGMGRGAFEVGFTRFATHHLGKTFTHPENWVLQWAVEFGWLGSTFLIALGGYAGWQLFKGIRRSPLALGLGVAVLCVIIHNLFDFSLEYLGVAVPFAIAAGAAVGMTETPRMLKVKRLWALPALVLLAAFACFMAWPPLRQSEAILEQARRDAARPADVRTAALPLIDRRPADYYLYSIVALSYASATPLDAQQALAFAERALYLYPHDTAAHRVAARSLLKLGARSQAFLEYRLAFETALDRGAVLAEATRYATSPEMLVQVVPTTPADTLQLVRYLRDHGRLADAASVALRAISGLEDRKGLGELALLATSWLIELKKPDEAAQVLTAVEAELGITAEFAVAKATIDEQRQQTDSARATLEAALVKNPGHLELCKALFRLLVAQGSYAKARDVLGQAQAHAIDTQLRAELIALEAGSYLSEGQLERALAAYKSAVRVAPHANRHAQVASIQLKLKRYSEAIASYRAAQQLDSNNPKSYWEGLIQQATTDQLLELEKEQKQRAAPTP